MEPAPAVVGSSIPRLTPSLPDLAKLFLSLSGSLAQRDVIWGLCFRLLASPVPGCCLVLLLRWRPQPPFARSSASVVSPAGAASATGSASRLGSLPTL